jgi:membrane fusion protein
MRKLFRQEAIDAQREKLLGEVSVARPVPLWVFTALAGAAAVALIAFVFWGEYTRRERVEGFLSTDAGAARISAPDPGGIVVELLVKEGQEIERGAVIARLSHERSTNSGASTSERIKQSLDDRLARLSAEQEQARQLAVQQAEQLRRKIADLKRELAQVDTEISQQKLRAAYARADVQRMQDLVKNGFQSEGALAAERSKAMEQETRVSALQRQRMTTERELGAATAELPTIETKARTAVDQLARQKSEVEQAQALEDARRESTVRSEIAGTVTNIAAARGDVLAEGAPIATVLPKGSGLHAQLLVPTRAIGFVQPGHEVVLRYEAFPFQRFGQYRGVVENVSRTVWTTNEKVGPLVVREPAYRIDVRLERQSVAAAGQELPLRPGMLVNADILLEKRTVFEWVFEPVLELKSRLL